MAINMYIFVLGYILHSHVFTSDNISDGLSIISNSSACTTSSSGSFYALCLQDMEGEEVPQVYPGRLKTFELDVYFPEGLTANVSIHIIMSYDLLVVINSLRLMYNDSNVNLENATYIPMINEIPGKEFLKLYDNGIFFFGDVKCDETRDLNRTQLCREGLQIDYLLANITDVEDNSTHDVSVRFLSNNATLNLNAPLVLRKQNFNISKKPHFDIDIPEYLDFPSKSLKTLKVKMLLPNPLSHYMFLIQSHHRDLNIASFRVSDVGDHYMDFLTKEQDVSARDMVTYCSSPGLDNVTLDIGYLPNMGAFTETNEKDADLIELELVLLMTAGAGSSDEYVLEFNFEVDFTAIWNASRYFNVTSNDNTSREVITTVKHSTLTLAKSAFGEVKLLLQIPPAMYSYYNVDTNVRQIKGSGSNGLEVVGIRLSAVGLNLPCILSSKHSRKKNSFTISGANIPYLSTSTSLGFRITVLAYPHLANAGDVYVLTVSLSYEGQKSPQLFEFNFTISDEEIFTSAVNAAIEEECTSITPTTNVDFSILTNFENRYGRLFIELPMATSLDGASFILCNFGRSHVGHNVIGHFSTTITRDDSGMIEKVVEEISPLSNIMLLSTYNHYSYLNYTMTVRYNNETLGFKTIREMFTARIISNNQTIWTGQVPLEKPKIARYPDFIVMTGMEKETNINPENLWFHYYRNDVHFGSLLVTWDDALSQGTSDIKVLDYPKVISSFYFSTNTCIAICHVSATFLPLTHYIVISNDSKKKILKSITYALDQDENTCFSLPVQGDTPPLLWLNIRQLSLFNVNSNNFLVNLIGDGLQCNRLGLNKTLHVGTSLPVSNGECSFDSLNIKFCKVETDDPYGERHRCSIRCICNTQAECSNVHIVLKSFDKEPWNLCEVNVQS